MRIFLFAAVCLLNACTEGGHWQHYRFSAFEEAKDRNMTIYLHFHADGNSLSESQKPVLEKIIQDPKFKKVGAYRVIMGTEKALENVYHVTSAGAVLVLKGGKELGRTQTATSEDELLKLLARGL